MLHKCGMVAQVRAACRRPGLAPRGWAEPHRGRPGGAVCTPLRDHRDASRGPAAPGRRPAGRTRKPASAEGLPHCDGQPRLSCGIVEGEWKGRPAVRWAGSSRSKGQLARAAEAAAAGASNGLQRWSRTQSRRQWPGSEAWRRESDPAMTGRGGTAGGACQTVQPRVAQQLGSTLRRTGFPRGGRQHGSGRRPGWLPARVCRWFGTAPGSASRDLLNPSHCRTVLAQ